MPALIAAGLVLDDVRGLSFDAADTLFHSEATWQLIGPVFEQYGLTRDAWSAAVAATGATGAWPEDSHTAAQRRARWAEFYRSCLARTSASSAVELAELAADAITDPSRFSTFADVPACLERLAGAGLPLVVTSNFDRLLYDILDHLELRRWFSAVICSLEVGAYKPAPAVFREAAASARLPVEAVAHIGDSPMSDAGGAQLAGMTPILLDRGGRTVTSVLTISSLDALGWR